MLTLVCVVGFVVAEPLESAALDPGVRQGVALYDALAFRRAALKLRKAVADPHLGLADRKIALAYLGRTEASLGRSAEAENAFVKLLALDPDFQVDRRESPVIRASLDAARARTAVTSPQAASPEPPAAPPPDAAPQATAPSGDSRPTASETLSASPIPSPEPDPPVRPAADSSSAVSALESGLPPPPQPSNRILRLAAFITSGVALVATVYASSLGLRAHRVETSAHRSATPQLLAERQMARARRLSHDANLGFGLAAVLGAGGGAMLVVAEW